MDIRPLGNIAQAAPTFVEPATSGSASAIAGKSAIASTQMEAAVQQPSSAQVSQALQSLNKAMQSMSNDLEFTVDDASDRTIVRVVDQQTGETIRQMPTKEALEIAKAIDKMQGILLRQKA